MRKTLTSDGSWTCFSETYGQTFHSSYGAVTESRQVFLQASGVQARLQTRRPTRVLEVGFGLGLNFLVTADLAAQWHCNLHYLAFEHTLIDHVTFAELNYASLVTHQAVYATALAAFEAGNSGTVAASTGPEQDCQCELTVQNSDFSRAILPGNHFDAVYLDAFSPDCNPECWDEQSFSRLFDCLKDGGTLSTYSAKGSVRRALLAVGFDVQKLPGPPGKRETLLATTKKSP